MKFKYLFAYLAFNVILINASPGKQFNNVQASEIKAKYSLRAASACLFTSERKTVK